MFWMPCHSCHVSPLSLEWPWMLWMRMFSIPDNLGQCCTCCAQSRLISFSEDNSCVPIQGQHTSRTHPSPPAKAGSFRETCRQHQPVVKWDSLPFGAFPGCDIRCSHPCLYVTIYAGQVHESDKKVRVSLPCLSWRRSSFSFSSSCCWKKFPVSTGYGLLRCGSDPIWVRHGAVW